MITYLDASWFCPGCPPSWIAEGTPLTQPYPYYVIHRGMLGYRVGRLWVGILGTTINDVWCKYEIVHILDDDEVMPATREDFERLRLRVPPDFGACIRFSLPTVERRVL